MKQPIQAPCSAVAPSSFPRRLAAAAVCAAVFGLAAGPALPALAGEVKIKLATIAPKDSAWDKVIQRFAAKIKEKTQGRVTFQIFAGGVKGDEKNVLRLMKTGSMDAGAFLGPGMGEIVSEVRVLEMPFQFNTGAEVDCVREKLTPTFEKKFTDKGFVLAAWGEAGFIRLYSNRRLTKMDEFAGVKMWALADDPLAPALAQAYKLQPTYLGIPDVLTALQTNMINGFYAPPYGAIALQWHTKVKYMTKGEIAYAAAGVVISKKTFDQISPEDQKLFLEESKAAGGALIKVARQKNEEAVALMKKDFGIEEVEGAPGEEQKMRALAVGVRDSFIGKLYEKPLVEQVDATLKSFRATGKCQ
jgi:TRAP-type transport system periplasmic protein